MPNRNQSNLLSHLPVNRFLALLASETPAPGGGAAAALAGALGAALVSMVAGLTLGRPRYAAVEELMGAIRDRAIELRVHLQELIDLDARAYGAVMDVARMPAPTSTGNPIPDPDRDRRQQAALRHATDIPLAVANACVEVLRLAVPVVQQGNRNATGDAAAAARMADAGLQIAALNVRTNLASVDDVVYVAASMNRIKALLADGQIALAQTLVVSDAGGGRVAGSE